MIKTATTPMTSYEENINQNNNNNNICFSSSFVSTFQPNYEQISSTELMAIHQCTKYEPNNKSVHFKECVNKKKEPELFEPCRMNSISELNEKSCVKPKATSCESLNEDFDEEIFSLAHELEPDELKQLHLCTKHKKFQNLLKNYALLKEYYYRDKLYERRRSKAKAKRDRRKSQSQLSHTIEKSDSNINSYSKSLTRILSRLNCFTIDNSV